MIGNVGVHIAHCCKWHGCKYGDKDCPVCTGKVKQEYLCEYCHDDLDVETHYKRKLKHIEEMKAFMNHPTEKGGEE